MADSRRRGRPKGKVKMAEKRVDISFYEETHRKWNDLRNILKKKSR